MNAKAWSCVGIGACTASFVATTLPYLQYAAAIIAIIVGIKAWFSKK